MLLGEPDCLGQIPLEPCSKDSDNHNQADAEHLTDHLHNLVVNENNCGEQVVERRTDKSRKGVNSLSEDEGDVTENQVTDHTAADRTHHTEYRAYKEPRSLTAGCKEIKAGANARNRENTDRERIYVVVDRRDELGTSDVMSVEHAGKDEYCQRDRGGDSNLIG